MIPGPKVTATLYQRTDVKSQMGTTTQAFTKVQNITGALQALAAAEKQAVGKVITDQLWWFITGRDTFTSDENFEKLVPKARLIVTEPNVMTLNILSLQEVWLSNNHRHVECLCGVEK